MQSNTEFYLLFSADVIGSTALKHKQDADWISEIENFYEKFPDFFKKYAQQFDLQVWKYQGDEILFYCNLDDTNLSNAKKLIKAYVRSVQNWNKSQYGVTNPLYIKGTIWSARIPRQDKRLPTAENEPLDFIGPSVDSGFRLAKYATENHIIVSVEVVGLCLDSDTLLSSLYYYDSVELKGVFLGKIKYPVFFLNITDIMHEFNSEKYADIHLRTPCDRKSLETFLGRFQEELRSCEELSNYKIKMELEDFSNKFKFGGNKIYESCEKPKYGEEDQNHIQEMKSWLSVHYQNTSMSKKDALYIEFDYPENEIDVAVDGIFGGKKLLMLGTNAGSVEIVNYAKENGAYTIVADFLEKEKSEAKKIADESVLISTADLDKLGNLIEEKKVDGVLAGISEFNLLQAMTLSEKYNLNFYCTREQWNNIENKENFRKLCIKHNVPCPKTYFYGEKIPENLFSSLKFPLVIKPVDSSASAGVHICENENDLRTFEQDSIKQSSCGKIIIEEFVQGTEFTAHYSICNGNVSLSCIDNRYPVAVHEGKVTTIPVARIYPCLFTKEYIESVDMYMKNLCLDIGIKNGILFVQGIYNKNAGFAIFEGGLRSAAETPSRFLKVVNDVNYLSILVDHALLGHTVSFQSKNEDPLLNEKCCGIVSFVAKGGKVGAINGLQETIEELPSVLDYEVRYPVGSITPNGDTLNQLMIRFVMACESREQMAKDIDFINKNIEVLNDKGENMVIKFAPKRIYDVY